ncbi:MAG TPA: hypothetical protein VGX76_06725 [Pirellulales bacterium]|jgi:hypothetical protein|nr:hypothetical protein [Pirellulales bacterium]
MTFDRPLTFEDLEDRQLLSASYAAAPPVTAPVAPASSLVAAAHQSPSVVSADSTAAENGIPTTTSSAPTTGKASTAGMQDTTGNSTDALSPTGGLAAQSPDSTAAPSAGSSTAGSSTAGSSTAGSALDRSSGGTPSPSDASPGSTAAPGDSTAAVPADTTSSDGATGDSPSEYQSYGTAPAADYSSQPPSYAPADNYGANTSIYQQQVNQTVAAAQLTADQAAAARRLPSDQFNLSFARPADAPVVAAAAAAPAVAQPSIRTLLDKPGQVGPGPGVDSRAVSRFPSSSPVDAVVRFVGRVPLEFRATADPAALDGSVKQASEAEQSKPSPQIEPLLAGIGPIDLPALEVGVERFFARLESLGDELTDSDVAWRLGAFSLIAAGAAAALEFARGQVAEQPQEPLPFGGWRLPPPPRPKEDPT